jgi:hypothetical protein
MYWARKAGLALIFAGVFSTMGCCYHGQRFGSARDIGLGKIGCGTCMSGHNNCCPAGCPAKSTCSACATDEEGGRGNMTATVSYEEPPQATNQGGSVQRPVYVVQPERVSTGMIVNPNMVISPMPNLPAREIPVHDAQPRRD